MNVIFYVNVSIGVIFWLFNFGFVNDVSCVSVGVVSMVCVCCVIIDCILSFE